jgi:hypothetical protein
MKAKKKPLGTRAQVKSEKERERRIATTIFLAIILLATVFSVYFGYTILNSSPSLSSSGPALQFNPENPDPELKAAIVDQLSLTYPNQTFIEAATDILKQAGYTVDYYSGEKVTVEFYRDLPTHDYRVIVLRVHSALCGDSPPVNLFTSEAYSATKYLHEQLTDQIGEATFLPYHEGDPAYFSINAGFLRQSLHERFQNTTIIMMGCGGLAYEDLAKAFIERGAKVYIGWSGSVLASHTDQATISLLNDLILKKQTIRQAGENTMNEVGPDPSSKSILGYYPDEAGEQTIENINNRS